MILAAKRALVRLSATERTDLSRRLGNQSFHDRTRSGRGRRPQQPRSVSSCHRTDRSRCVFDAHLLRPLARRHRKPAGRKRRADARRDRCALRDDRWFRRRSRRVATGRQTGSCQSRRGSYCDSSPRSARQIQSRRSGQNPACRRPGHTRLPAYARGRRGRIVALHGGWVFPDTNAHGRGETPQHLYTVAFDGAELWGKFSEPGLLVHLDLFEPYLLLRRGGRAR